MLEQRAQIEIVSIGQLAPALAALADGTQDGATVVANFTGSSLEQRIAAAEPGIITPPSVAITNYKTLEGDGGGVLRYEVRIFGDVVRPVSVDYQTLDGDATAGEFTPVAGALTWEPGDTSSRVIEVPFIGDDVFEDDEAVVVALTNISNAVLANDLGAAYMINDDAFHFTTSADAPQNDLRLVLEGADAALYQNGENIFAGVFTEGVTSSITGQAGIADVLIVELGSDNTLLAGGLSFIGNGDVGDVLHLRNAGAASVIHTITGIGAGMIDVDGRLVAYQGLSQVSDDLAPQITGLPAGILEADSVDLGSLLPASDDPVAVTYAWSLRYAGALIATSATHSFSHTFADDGGYEIELTVSAPGRATSTQIVQLEVGNIQPTPVIESISDLRVEGTQIDIVASATDPAGSEDTLTYSYQVFKYSDTEAFASESGVDQSTFSFTPDDNGTYEIVLTVNDEDGGSAQASQTILVDNVDPTVTVALAEASIDENGVVTLNSTITDPGTLDTFTVEIDWNTDGNMGGLGEGTTMLTQDDLTFVAPGVYHFSTTHQYLDDNPTGDPSNIYTIGVTLTDDDAGEDTASTTVTVNNFDPAIESLSAPGFANKGIEGSPISLSGTFSDVGLLDTHQARVNWGDDSPIEWLSITELDGSGSFSGVHAYADGGIYTVTVTLTDDDSGEHTLTTSAVITGAGILNGTLTIVGTLDDDHVTINQQGNGQLKVHADFLPSGNFKTFDLDDVQLIDAYLSEGNDHLTMAGNIRIPAILDGGGGDDYLKSSRGLSVLLGGAGNDKLNAGQGRSWLIGGAGRDSLNGGNNDDILMGGSLNADHESLLNLLDEIWARDDTYEDRVDGVIDRLNAWDALGIAEWDDLEDGEEDDLNGTFGTDLYFDGWGRHA